METFGKPLHNKPLHVQLQDLAASGTISGSIYYTEQAVGTI